MQGTQSRETGAVAVEAATEWGICFSHASWSCSCKGKASRNGIGKNVCNPGGSWLEFIFYLYIIVWGCPPARSWEDWFSWGFCIICSQNFTTNYTKTKTSTSKCCSKNEKKVICKESHSSQLAGSNKQAWGQSKKPPNRHSNTDVL